MKNERVTFEVDGTTVVGNLHWPETAPLAAVVLTGPLTSVKEQASGAYARALATRGFAALAFDHRTFGESAGEPRQYESPPRKIADIRAAADFLGRRAVTAAVPLAEAFEYYGTARGAVPNYTNRFAVQSREFTLPFDAMLAADRIRVPTLVVHSEKALVPAWARQFYARLTAPKQELWLESQGQIDFYDDP